MSRKFSRQRESIRQNLLERRDHPTADMVFADIRREYPNISLGTVYRNLSLFAQSGEIRKLPSMDGADRFDGNMAPHHHFICRNCGEIQDLFFPESSDEQLIRNASPLVEGTVTDCSMTFRGICRRCAAEQD